MRKKITVLVGCALLSTLALSGCGDKALEGFQDAHIDGRNTNPAMVGTMPDGFSNFAAKCDGPNMVYVVFHGDSSYGSIDVVPNDPRCN